MTRVRSSRTTPTPSLSTSPRFVRISCAGHGPELASNLHTEPGCDASAGSPSPDRCCAPHTPRSVSSARRPGQHRHAPNYVWPATTAEPLEPVHELLSPQELQIARLAADALSNREIGERLFLSHRTVGSHLYRIFPKLGITSRGQLSERRNRCERDPIKRDDDRTRSDRGRLRSGRKRHICRDVRLMFCGGEVAGRDDSTPNNPPTGSIAAATWTSRWVSTPPTIGA